MRLACAPNFRDLGGIPAANGRRIAHGKVFRSDAIIAPVGEDEAVLLGHGIRLVCDLRSLAECSAAPNVWWQASGAELMHLDVAADIRGTAHWQAMQNDPGESGAAALMRLTYRAMPEAAANHLRRLFARIAEGHLPLIIHCAAGKDRTGVVVALLLSALDVPREAIYHDYLESGFRQSPQIVEHTRSIMSASLGRELEQAALQALCGVRAEYLDEAFAAITEKCSSTARFLAEVAGVDAAMQEALRDRLIV